MFVTTICLQRDLESKEKDLFLPERGLDRSVIKPGMFFLNRRTATDWSHVGIVLEANDEAFMSIEPKFIS